MQDRKRETKPILTFAVAFVAVFVAMIIGFLAFSSPVKQAETENTSAERTQPLYDAEATEIETEDTSEPVAEPEAPVDTEIHTATPTDAKPQEPAPEETQPEPEQQPATIPAPAAEPVAPAPEEVVEEVEQPAPSPTPEPDPVQQQVVQTRVLSKATMSLPDYVSQKALPSVVSVVARDGVEINFGAGSIISSDGLVVTVFHALRPNENTITIICNGKKYPARIRGYNVTNDVALLQMQLNGDVVTPVEIADSNSVQVGDWVMSIGSPLGTLEYTYGNVTELGCDAITDLDAGGQAIHHDMIGSSAWSTYGYSGGPLLDEDGRLIGMNANKVDNENGDWIESLAIPSNQITRIVNEVLSN